MQDHERLIQELRSLAGDPSSSAWASICKRLDELERTDSVSVSRCLPDLLKSLISWPDSLRACPVGWCEAFVSGDKSPKLAIVRCLTLEQMRSLAESGRLYSLIKSPSLKYLTSLDLRICDQESDPMEDSLTDDDLPLPAIFQRLADRDDVTLSGIDLSLGIDLSQLEVLLRSKALSECRHLGLAWAEVTPDLLIETLIGADCPLRLESLNLNWASRCGEYISDYGLKRFMNSACSRDVKSLRLKGYDLTEQGIEWLAQSPNCHGLEDLEISSIGGREAGPGPIEKLAASPYMTNLRQLIYLDSQAGDLSAKLIADTPSLSDKLTRLELDGDITATGAETLATARTLASLTYLNLSGNQSIGESGCLSMAEARWMYSLDHIDLSCVGMTNTGLAAILRSIGQPTFFDVGINRFEAGSMTLIGESQRLQRVRTFDLSDIRFDESEITAFVTSPAFADVESLRLSFCSDQPADQLIVELAQSPHWRGLKRLDLSHNSSTRIRSGIRSFEFGISDQALIAIANSPILENLTELNLSHNGITSEGVVALSQSKLLSQLTALRLDNNRICDSGLMALARSPHIHQLRELTLYSNQLTEQTSDAVAQSSLPKIRVLALSRLNFHGGLICNFIRAPGADEWPEDFPEDWPVSW